MTGPLRWLFGAHAQVALGATVFVIGLGFWVLGCYVIPGAWAAPWQWRPVAFVFHVSMFYGQVACYSIVSGGLGYKATERVETVVANIEQADNVEVQG